MNSITNKYTSKKIVSKNLTLRYTAKTILFYMIKLTQYRIGVHPSIVTHWNTVNMAKTILSKDVIP